MDIENDWLSLSREDFLNKWYSQYYSKTSYGCYSGSAHQYLHKSIERRYSSTDLFSRTLELGGNTGEHVPFVHHKFDEYFLVDKFDNLDENAKSVLKNGKIQFVLADAEALPFEDKSFDRILCTCLLHHVFHPELVLTEIRRLLKPGAPVDIFLSSDPGMLFRLGRNLTTKRNSSILGLKRVKELVDARDHINHTAGLETLISHVFRNDKITKKTYPFSNVGWNFSFWSVFHIEKV